MKQFLDQDFLLSNDTAKWLYHDVACDLPIIDFHNHLNVQEIYEDQNYSDMAQVWLGGDHYKWRAMRSCGIDESLITGDGEGYDKFRAYASAMPNLVGNPLFHWTHLELQRYFDIQDVLSEKSADKIWNEANAKLATPACTTRNLLANIGVKVLCTTDDPADSLEYHLKLRDEEKRFKTLPTFRPEKAMGIDKPGFIDYIVKLGDVSDVRINTYNDLKLALSKRLQFFYDAGCRITDHSLEGSIFAEYTEDQVANIFAKAISGRELEPVEVTKYKGAVLVYLASEYKKLNMVMQLHIGALRNNSTRMFNQVGVDAGFDCVDDFNYASQLSALLDACDVDDNLPKTILYCLNGTDTSMLASMIGNFQSSDAFGKIQLGSAWWFCDHKSGMENQLRNLSEYGALGTFVGMVTDSRSFLSFPRHEYFRRILCNYVGTLVENGEYPNDREALTRIIRGICCDNALNYLGIDI